MNADNMGLINIINNPATDTNPDWQPIPGRATPNTKDDCKKGGYKEFGFKNQGGCIAFVN
jgi:hypothetical protein